MTNDEKLYSYLFSDLIEGRYYKAQAKRVDVAFKFCLKLSCSLVSRQLSSTLNLLEFFLRVIESFLLFGPGCLMGDSR